MIVTLKPVMGYRNRCKDRKIFGDRYSSYLFFFLEATNSSERLGIFSKKVRKSQGKHIRLNEKSEKNTLLIFSL